MRTAALILLTGVLAQADVAPEYRRTRIPDSSPEVCLAWQQRSYVYRVDTAGSERTPGTAENVAIRASFDTWSALAAQCSDFVFREGEPISDPKVGFIQGGKNDNVLTFRETSCLDAAPPEDDCFFDATCGNKYRCWSHGELTIALTKTVFSTRTGVIFDADIEFNAVPEFDGYPGFLFTTISSPPCLPGEESPLCVATDIQNTLTHEIGHVVGLDHVDVIGSTMEPSAPLGETQKRIIDPGTARGFCNTYPRGQPPGSCEDGARISQQIVATNRGTPGLEGIGCQAGVGTSGLLVLLLGALRRPRGRAGPRPRG